MDPATIEKRERVTRFLNDRAMSQTVYQILLDTFVKERESTDVNTLAAQKIAIDLLQEAWKVINKIKNEQQAIHITKNQPGL